MSVLPQTNAEAWTMLGHSPRCLSCGEPSLVDRSPQLQACTACHDVTSVGALVKLWLSPPLASKTKSNTWLDRLEHVDAKWLSDAPPPRRYLMRDLRTDRGAVPELGVALIVAAGGVGKSFVTIDATLSVATCLPWLGVMCPYAPGRVLIVSAEDPASELRHRIYDVARVRGIGSVDEGAIEIIDVHDRHTPLLDAATAAPTDHARALVELVEAKGPYALVIIDPLARISGASIDGDTVAACALISVLEEIATAAGGLVLGVHHTSQTARRMNIKDATAIRGATALGDSARLVMVLTAEEVDVSDTPQWSDLGEIVTLTRAKANHVARWEPIQMRRGEHGVLLPLDGGAREIVAKARAAAHPSSKREETKRKRSVESAARAADAVVRVLERVPEGLSYRRVRDAVQASLGSCSDSTLGAAIARLESDGRVVRADGPRSSTLHRLAQAADEAAQ